MKLQFDNLLKKRDSLDTDDNNEIYLLPKFKKKIEIILTNSKKMDNDSLTQKYNTIIYAINYCQEKIIKNNKSIDKILLNKLIEDFSDILQPSNNKKIKYFQNTDDSLVANELKKHAKKIYEPLKMTQELDKWIEENNANKKNCIKAKNKILEAYENESTYLSLARLYLKNVPPVIGKLINLRKLDLSHNQITIIEESVFYGLIHLKRLDLSYNKLDKISPKALDSINIHCQISPSRTKLKLMSINHEEKIIHDEIARELINIRNNYINSYFKNKNYMLLDKENIKDYNNYIDNNNYIELDNKKLNLRNEITWENILDISEDTLDKIENTKFILLKRGSNIYDIYDLPAINQWLIKNQKGNLFTKKKVKADEIIGGQELLDILQIYNSKSF